MGLGKNLFLKDSVIGRNLSLDVLRVLACFGVMFIHISSSFSTHQIAVEGTAGWYAGRLIGVFSKWAVPAFVMITGFFLIRKTDFNIKRIERTWLKAFFFVVIIYGTAYLYDSNVKHLKDIFSIRTGWSFAFRTAKPA